MIVSAINMKTLVFDQEGFFFQIESMYYTEYILFIPTRPQEALRVLGAVRLRNMPKLNPSEIPDLFLMN